MGYDFYIICDSNESVGQKKSSVIRPILERMCKAYGIKFETANLEGGDFWLVLLPDPKNGRKEEVVLVVEFKSLGDLLSCETSNHEHFRTQINAFHLSDAVVGGKLIISLGDPKVKDARMTPQQKKAYDTLFVRCLFEHENRVHMKHFDTEDDLIAFLLKAGETFSERRAGKKIFDAVVRVNHSMKKKTPSVKEDWLQLHLREVRRVGVPNAMKMAKKHKSIVELVDNLRKHGPNYLVKEGDLGKDLAAAVYHSFGFPEGG